MAVIINNPVDPRRFTPSHVSVEAMQLDGRSVAVANWLTVAVIINNPVDPRRFTPSHVSVEAIRGLLPAARRVAARPVHSPAPHPARRRPGGPRAVSVKVQSAQYLPEFRYPDGAGWEIDPDGTLNIRDENGALIASHARGSWDAVMLLEDQGGGDANRAVGAEVGPIDPPRPANHHPVA